MPKIPFSIVLDGRTIEIGVETAFEPLTQTEVLTTESLLLIEETQKNLSFRPHAQGMNRLELAEFLNSKPKPSTKENPFGL